MQTQCSIFSVASRSMLRPSDAQNTGVENAEADLPVTCAQGTARPFALDLAEYVLPLRNRHVPPFHFGHEQALAILRKD